MNWNKITTAEDVEKLTSASNENPVLIFKHSTRCSISSTALNRLERSWTDEDSNKIQPFYLDLIAHRDLSNLIAEKFNILHESPQVLIIKNGVCSYNNSHMGINHNDIIAEVS